MITAASHSKPDSPSLSGHVRLRSDESLSGIEQHRPVKAPRLSPSYLNLNNAQKQNQISLENIQSSETINKVLLGETYLDFSAIEPIENNTFKDILKNSKHCFIGIGQTVSRDAENPTKEIFQHYLIENIATWLENPTHAEPLTRNPVEKVNIFTVFKDESSGDLFGSFNMKDKLLTIPCKFLIACFISDDEVNELSNLYIVSEIYQNGSEKFLNKQKFNNELKSNSINVNLEKSAKILQFIESNSLKLDSLNNDDKMLFIKFCSAVNLQKARTSLEDTSKANNVASPSELVGAIKSLMHDFVNI